jgi:hypothetical protein
VFSLKEKAVSTALSSFVRKRCLIMTIFQFQKRIKPAFPPPVKKKGGREAVEKAKRKEAEAKGVKEKGKQLDFFLSPFPFNL